MAVEVELDDLLDRAAPEVGVGRALGDPEEELALGPRRLALALRPERRQPDRLREVVAPGRRADVEAHRDVGAELRLDRGHGLGREPLRGAVVDGAERDAVVVDARDRVAQREDLVAAGVGEDRPVPLHELVQPAELVDHVLARAEVQVVRVAEDDLRAERSAPRRGRAS